MNTKVGTGFLRRVENPKPNHPDCKASVIINGIKYWLAGWRRVGDDGKVWLSLGVEVSSDESAEQPKPARTYAARRDDVASDHASPPTRRAANPAGRGRAPEGARCRRPCVSAPGKWRSPHGGRSCDPEKPGRGSRRARFVALARGQSLCDGIEVRGRQNLRGTTRNAEPLIEGGVFTCVAHGLDRALAILETWELLRGRTQRPGCV